MNVLSLFNGISGCHLALDRAAVSYDNVYYSEVDKFANKVTENNYPQDIPLGDVTKYMDWNLDWSSIGLVTAGFPCQSWSVAGQGLGDKDERGMLFWTTLEIIKKVLDNNPDAKFMMENVKMKKEFEEYITLHTTEALGYVEKTLINSALVSTQNRNRYYWTNFKVTQPKDLGLVLSDVLEQPMNTEYELPKIYTERWVKYNPQKGNVLGTTKKEGTIGQKHNCYGLNGKMGCLTASMYKQPPQYVVLPNESIMKNGKSYALTANYAGAAAWNSCQRKQRSMVSIEESDIENPNCYNGILYRKLSPVECERLQNIPDNFTDCVSNSQRYKAIGNGWTIDVIAHIFSCAFSKIKPCINLN